MSAKTVKAYLAPRYWPTWILLGFMRVCAALPYRLALPIGMLLGRLMHIVLSERRHIARTNLKLCLPQHPEKQRKKIERACFQNMGISVMETSIAWWGSEKKLRSLYQIEGLEHIERAQQQSKCILLLSGHMSCTEIGARLLAYHINFQAMYKPAKNKLFEAVMLKNRSRYYHEMVPRKNTRRLLSNLKRRIITWYAPDQNFGHDETVFAPFFKIPATSLTATARIADIMNADVIPFFPYRLPNNKGYKLVIGKPLDQFPSGDALQDATRVNQTIEAAVLLAPEQYLWVHKRFRIQPPGEPTYY